MTKAASYFFAFITKYQVYTTRVLEEPAAWGETGERGVYGSERAAMTAPCPQKDASEANQLVKHCKGGDNDDSHRETERAGGHAVCVWRVGTCDAMMQ